MKYIRTEDGEILSKGKIICSAFNEEYCSPNWNEDIEKYLQTKIVAEANTIEELCDEYVINGEFGIYLVGVDELDRHAMGQTKEMLLSGQLDAYGAIWVIDSNGAPTLKPVAKANEKGELALL